MHFSIYLFIQRQVTTKNLQVLQQQILRRDSKLHKMQQTRWKQHGGLVSLPHPSCRRRWSTTVWSTWKIDTKRISLQSSQIRSWHKLLHRMSPLGKRYRVAPPESVTKNIISVYTYMQTKVLVSNVCKINKWYNMMFELPVKMHRVRQSTFRQLFLCKRQSFQLPPLVALKKNFVLQGREQQYTLNQEHSSGLLLLSCKSNTRNQNSRGIWKVHSIYMYTMRFTFGE